MAGLVLSNTQSTSASTAAVPEGSSTVSRFNIELPLVLCVQEEEDEAQEEEDASKLRDSIASMKWLQKHEGAAWAGSGAGDPIKQHKLQQAASIKKWVVGAKLRSMPVLYSCCV